MVQPGKSILLSLPLVILTRHCTVLNESLAPVSLRARHYFLRLDIADFSSKASFSGLTACRAWRSLWSGRWCHLDYGQGVPLINAISWTVQVNAPRDNNIATLCKEEGNTEEKVCRKCKWRLINSEGSLIRARGRNGTAVNNIGGSTAKSCTT